MSRMEQVNADSEVTLREVTAETVRAVCRLEVAESQKGFVAPNAVSIAQAYFEPKAWFRAIYADETPVGFAMVYDDPEAGEYYLWRFMVAAHYQGLGFGRRGLALVIAYVRDRPNAENLLTSFVPGEGSPRGFYLKQGFVETGVMHGDELELRLDFGSPHAYPSENS